MTRRGKKIPDELVVLLGERIVGRVERAGNNLEFIYHQEWRDNGPKIPLSISMPLSGTKYGHDLISNWMWGLLTENEFILSRIAKKHQISANTVFALLWAIGEDCAGAVQFAEPGRVEELAQDGEISWLDENEIGNRLRALRQDHSTGRASREGQFSLAGAQPKTALTLIDGSWGVPSGRIPTTHILKPPITDLKGHAQNEVFCLRLAEQLGLRAAHAEVKKFAGELAIVVQRYDRVRTTNDRIIRVHQEDFCQALAVHPASKYQKDGGPGIAEIMELLNWSSNPAVDRRRFMEATALNFVIAGIDAHAKNFSIIFGPDQARLAPLYDIASYLPYVEGRWEDERMPMKVDKSYLYAKVYPRHWERMAKTSGYPADEAVAHVIKIATKIPDTASAVVTAMRDDGMDHPVLDILIEKLTWRCQEILRLWRPADLPHACPP
jgi:serine/threonine-protein kinase HipA